MDIWAPPERPEKYRLIKQSIVILSLDNWKTQLKVYFRFLMQASFKMEDYCSVSCLPILLMFLLLYSYVHGNLFEEVSSCPSNKEEWMDRAQKKGCQEPIPDYMCAAIENQTERFGEICTVVGLTSKGNNLHRLKPLIILKI